MSYPSGTAESDARSLTLPSVRGAVERARGKLPDDWRVAVALIVAGLANVVVAVLWAEGPVAAAACFVNGAASVALGLSLLRAGSPREQVALLGLSWGSYCVLIALAILPW